tara:strand:- start:157 stop:537 length:381 start_codon:yes stop_codon:yes gene_type:complete
MFTKTFRLIQFLLNLVLRPSALILFLVSGVDVAGAKTEFTPVDRWYEVFLGGAKVGYFQDLMQKDGEVIKSRNEFVIQIKRTGQSIEMTVEQETKEKVSGELIDFLVRHRWQVFPCLKRGEWKGRN